MGFSEYSYVLKNILLVIQNLGMVQKRAFPGKSKSTWNDLYGIDTS